MMSTKEYVECARQKERERRQQAVDKAQAALGKAVGEHAERAAATQIEIEALEKRRAEGANWTGKGDGSKLRCVARDYKPRAARLT
jgi:hypothetical protein